MHVQVYSTMILFFSQYNSLNDGVRVLVQLFYFAPGADRVTDLTEAAEQNLDLKQQSTD